VACCTLVEKAVPNDGDCWGFLHGTSWPSTSPILRYYAHFETQGRLSRPVFGNGKPNVISRKKDLLQAAVKTKKRTCVTIGQRSQHQRVPGDQQVEETGRVDGQRLEPSSLVVSTAIQLPPCPAPPSSAPLDYLHCDVKLVHPVPDSTTVLLELNDGLNTR
jgi:hypothetical protein